MIDKMTKWRAKHADRPETSLYPLTYVELINLLSLASFALIFILDRNLMQEALIGTPFYFFAEQYMWTTWKIVTICLLLLGHFIPQFRIKVRTLYINGRSLGLVFSTGIWTMYSGLLWFLNPTGLFNVTITALAFTIFVVGTKVLAYER